MSTATKSNPTLWKRIVARIKAQASHGTRAGSCVLPVAEKSA